MAEQKEGKWMTRCINGKVFKWFIVAVVAVVFTIIYEAFLVEHMRFDQYMSAICTTTAALVGTMFGLSAASYAFVCGEMRTEEKNDSHLRCVLTVHRKKLWAWFVYSLVFMVSTIATSLLCLALAQSISAADLFRVFPGEEATFYATYANRNHQLLSAGVFLNLLFTSFAMASMIVLNWKVFQRENSYSSIAKKLAKASVEKYEKPQVKEELLTWENLSVQAELEKIHNLERVLDRVVRNHESESDIFLPGQQIEEILSVVIQHKLFFWFDEGKTEEDKDFQRGWSYLKGKKKEALVQWQANQVKRYSFGQSPLQREIGQVQQKKTEDCSFPELYGDLIRYRDSLIVYSRKGEPHRELHCGRHLRWAAKVSILAFLLREEPLDHMDLSGVCFSGGNLRRTNFTGSDLSGCRFLGADCSEADFSDTRMPGMFFEDNREECSGEIALSYRDDDEDAWDPYKGRQATCFRGATFARADVSRAFLVARGGTWEAGFPFNKSRQMKSRLYSMEGTSFFGAKLYSSRFRDISFDQASLERAQVFDSVFFRCSAVSVNFQSAVLTHSCLLWCDFNGANGGDAVLAGGALFRCDFSKARLENASFAEANLVHCNFEGASCQNVSFRGVVQAPKDMKALPFLKMPFVRSCGIPDDTRNLCLNFKFSMLSKTDFSEADLSQANFDQAIGADCIFTKAKGIGIYMNDAVLRGSVFNETKFTQGHFVRTVFRDSVFVQTQFVEGDFDGADFGGALFNPGENPCFVNVDLRDVSFQGAVGLTASCFRDVTLNGCNLRGTGLDKAILEAMSGVTVGQDCLFDEPEEWRWKAWASLRNGKVFGHIKKKR